jgi:hypothetical protein
MWIQMTRLAVSTSDNKFPEPYTTHTADPKECLSNERWPESTTVSGNTVQITPIICIYSMGGGGGGGTQQTWLRWGTRGTHVASKTI